GQRPLIHWRNKLRSGEVTETELTRAEVKAHLPTYILGYSSGHNEILSLPFLKMRFIHFDEYRERLTKDLDYDGRPEGRLIYLDVAPERIQTMTPDDQKDSAKKKVELTAKLAGHYNEDNELQLGLIDKL